MPRQKTVDKIESLRKKQEQIAAQLKLLDARQRENARREDARRKIIAGALALEHMTRNPDSEFAAIMHRLLTEYVEPRSRYLFPALTVIEEETPVKVAV